MKHQIKLQINGKVVKGEVDSRTLLVQFLRDQLDLTGTHVGCDTASCGACTISMDGQAVKSCNILAVQADGLELITIEGLASENSLHPIQQAFNEEHGLQCGFCTPGMIMTAQELLKQNPNPSDEEIRHQLEGNFCRCTGYENIVRSVKRAVEISQST